MVLLVLVLVAFGAITPTAVRHYEAAATTVRIAVAVAILVPIGFFMGMAFPIGMHRALREVPAMTPWLWGVNGAASVSASVLVVVISLAAGISTAFWVGTACYVVALIGLGAGSRLWALGSGLQALGFRSGSPKPKAQSRKPKSPKAQAQSPKPIF
jgi:hypothetical protein